MMLQSYRSCHLHYSLINALYFTTTILFELSHRLKSRPICDGHVMDEMVVMRVMAGEGHREL